MGHNWYYCGNKQLRCVEYERSEKSEKTSACRIYRVDLKLWGAIYPSHIYIVYIVAICNVIQKSKSPKRVYVLANYIKDFFLFLMQG